jgi:hypothetical protein
LRQFERWLGRLYAMMFNPSNYQLRQPANDVRFELMASSGGAETYKVKMKELSETGEHNLPHEKQYLGLLIGLLGRLEEWLKDVYGKFRSTPDIENITWGDFLKRQKII